MGQLNLSVFVREEVGLRSLQHAETPCLKAGCMFSGANSTAASLDANHPNARIPEKRVKKTNGVTPATNARHQQLGQPLLLLENLAPRLFTDDPVQIPNHHRAGMRAIGRPAKLISLPSILPPLPPRP